MGRLERAAKRVLVVQERGGVEGDIADVLARLGYRTRLADPETARHLALTRIPDLVVLEAKASDNWSLALSGQIGRMSPAPPVIAVAENLGSTRAFGLAKQGVRALLEKPFDDQDLDRAIKEALYEAEDLEPYVRQAARVTPLKDIVTHVRETTLDQALAMAKGNRTEAARLLGVSRQAVQQAIKLATSGQGV